MCACVNEDLREEGAGLLGLDVVVKARGGAAVEDAEVFHLVLFCDDACGVVCRIAQLGGGGIAWKFDIDEKLGAVCGREKLASEKWREPEAQNEERIDAGDCKPWPAEAGLKQPAVARQEGVDREIDGFEEKEGPDLPPLFEPLLPLEYIDAQHRDKCHRDDECGDQSEGYHHGHGVHEGALVAGQQHERQKRNDVDQRCEDDRSEQSLGAEPSGAQRGFSVVEFAVDAV